MLLSGPTIALVPLSSEHVVEFLRYCGEPSLWSWWLRSPPIDDPGMRREVALALSQKEAGLRVPFAVRHQKTGEHIGSMSIMHINKEHLSFEIGSSWLGLPFHGTGINQEAKQILLRYGFVELGLMRAVLQTDELNIRSRRAIEKLGARLEGIFREDKITWNGRVRSSAIYSILQREWRT